MYVLLIAIVFDFYHYRPNFLIGYVVYNFLMAIVFNFRNPLDTLCIVIARNVLPPILGVFFLLSIFSKDIDGSGLGAYMGRLIRGHIVISDREFFKVNDEIDKMYEEHLRKQQQEQSQEYIEEDYSVDQDQVVEKSPYEVLGVSEDATPSQIRAAFKKKTLENHPDRTGGLDIEFKKLAEARMKEINDAYDKLRKKDSA